MKSTLATLDPLHAKLTAYFTRYRWFIPVLIALDCAQCFGGTDKKDDTCLVKPGGTTILVPLQNAPNSFEPQCQPARIRVPDRTKVTIHITGLSPMDVCNISSKAPTVTTVTNPLEAIITSVTGLKNFGIGTGSRQAAAEMQQIQMAATGDPGAINAVALAEDELVKAAGLAEAKQDPQAALHAFSVKLTLEAAKVFWGQQQWLAKYQQDAKDIIKYAAKDYRKLAYSGFHPVDDQELADVRKHVALPGTAGPDPLPTEIDYAHLQSLVDQMSDLQKLLTDSCSGPDKKAPCRPSTLDEIETPIDSGKAIIAAAQDNLKTLQTTQASLVTAYTALVKVYEDYVFRRDILKSVTPEGPAGAQWLSQDIPVGPNYSATDASPLTCVSDAALTQATTDAITYAVLYQNVPRVTVSAGLLTTFLPKKIIGIQAVAGSSSTSTNYFKVTDSSRAQVFPMAFVNLRTGGAKLTTWPGEPENELVIANSVSAGIGINPNTGTNQAEFFLGDAVSFGRVYVHLGAHFGRTESLGGGFQLDTPTNGATSAPINWNYHVAFSIGLSVRLAPF